MAKTKNKKQKTKLMQKKKSMQNNIYVTIPNIVISNPDLNYTDKIVLSWIHGLPSTWNNISTKKIADMLNLERATINRSIKKLVFLELIKENYKTARKRVFRSLLGKTTDAAAIITDTVLADDSLTNTYKITQGILTAASVGKDNSLGGFNFNSDELKGIEVIAKRAGLSVSSVYRHLALLSKERFIEREYGSYFIKIQDWYVRNHAFKVSSKHNHIDNLALASSPPGDMDPETANLLDQIYDKL